MTNSSTKTSGKHISSEGELRAIISNYPKMLDKRILSALDKYCLEIVKHSSLIVFGCSDPSHSIKLLRSSAISIVDNQTIELGIDLDLSLDADKTKLPVSCKPVFASLYFLVPGIGHGLRVNGSLNLERAAVRLKVSGAYAHCARAAARSELWKPALSNSQCNDKTRFSHDHFLKHSSFLLLKTMNSEEQTELSPRGDQPGFVQQLGNNELFIPERPGNKVAISLRNILQNSSIELLMIIPGSSNILIVKGNAKLINDDALLDAAAVKTKRPKLGILIEDCEFTCHQSKALSEPQLWQGKSQTHPTQLTNFSKVLSAHMNGEGLLGKATTPVVKAIVKHDMNNLY